MVAAAEGAQEAMKLVHLNVIPADAVYARGLGFKHGVIAASLIWFLATASVVGAYWIANSDSPEPTSPLAAEPNPMVDLTPTPRVHDGPRVR